MVVQDFKRLVDVADVPTLDLAIVPTTGQVVLLVGIEVQVSNQGTVRVLYGINLPAKGEKVRVPHGQVTFGQLNRVILTFEPEGPSP